MQSWRSLALAIIGIGCLDLSVGHAQIQVQGAKRVTISPNSTVERETWLIRKRRPWRERNPYFVARPNYAPAPPGQRASVTFAPFSSLYYPNEKSYYPPVPSTTVVRPR